MSRSRIWTASRRRSRRAVMMFAYCDAPTGDVAAPDLRDADLLVVLGGPIGAYEEQDYPFLTPEIDLIERRLAAGRPVLGLCLGAQLMARALGARVYPAATKEIGWGLITLTGDGRRSPLGGARRRGGSALAWRHVRSAGGRAKARGHGGDAEPGLRVGAARACLAVSCRDHRAGARALVCRPYARDRAGGRCERRGAARRCAALCAGASMRPGRGCLAIGSTGWSGADKVVRNGKDQSHATADQRLRPRPEGPDDQSQGHNLAREMLTQN